MIIKNNITLTTIIKTIKIIFLIFIFGIVLFYVIENKNYISDVIKNLSFPKLIISFLILIINLLFQSFIWHSITKRIGFNMDIISNIIIFSYSNIAKYIPGKIFTYLTMISFYKKNNIGKKQQALAYYLSVVLNLLILSLFSISYLIFMDNYNNSLFLVVIMLVLLLILVVPKYLEILLNLSLKIFKKKSIELKLTFSQIFILLIYNLMNWMIFGFGFYFLVSSIQYISFNYYFYLLSVLSLSTLLGFIAFFSFAGFGVREGTLYYLIKNIFIDSVSFSISIVSRVWTLLGDVFLFLIGVTIDFLLKKNIYTNIMSYTEEKNK